jgi:hypothetical protein
MVRFRAYDPVKIQGEPSGPDLIQIKETTGSDNPESQPPQDGSLGEVLVHPEIVRTSGRTSIPNPMFDLITIYDDKESLEVSLVTSVKITKDKEPKKTSTLGSYASIQRHL